MLPKRSLGRRFLSRVLAARRQIKPYQVVLAGRGQPTCIARRATLDAANDVLTRAVAAYRWREGYRIVAREPFSVRMRKYVVDLDIFVELTLAVEYSEPITQSMFSLN